MYIYDCPSIASRGLSGGYGALHGLQGNKRPEVVSPATPAEVKQLTEEIIMKAQRNAWAGVDQAYKRLESMGDQAFDLIPKGLTSAADIHTKGAHAADASGEIKLKQTRLWRARKSMENAGVSPNAQVFIDNTNSLDAIDMAYGSVYIAPKTEPKTEKERKRLQGRGPELTRVSQPGEQPSTPEQPRSVETAAKAIRETGYFDGLLPARSYRLADQSFVVNAGTELKGKPRKTVRWGN